MSSTEISQPHVFLLARAMPQSKQSLQKVHTYNKTLVLSQSIPPY